MKRQLGYFVILLIIYSCQGKVEKNKEVDKSTLNQSQDDKISDTISYFDDVEYPSSCVEPDTMFMHVDDIRLMITPSGLIYKSDSTLIADLKCDGEIQKMYVDFDADTLYAVVEMTDMDNGWSAVLKMDFSKNKIIWKKALGGFNIGKPVIFHNKIYLSSIGVIAKIDRYKGEFCWKFSNLYDTFESKYGDFERVYFTKRNEVVFVSENVITKKKYQIVVDDLKGKILKKD
jgi:hypothetical protein